MPHALIIFLSSIAYAAAGSILLWAGYRIFDRLTPGDAHSKIFDEGNIAVAILVGAFVIGLAIVIAASMVG
jgi:putative membrane protein